MQNFKNLSLVLVGLASFTLISCAHKPNPSNEAASVPAKAKPKRFAASESFSGVKVGSSNTMEIPSMTEEDMKTSVASIAKQETVKNLEHGRVGLVAVDDGGSSDIGAAMAGNSLFLTFHNDGEWSNSRAAFNLGGINEFKILNVDKKNSTVLVQLSCKDETLKTITVQSLISFGTFEKKFAAHQGSGASEDVVISGKVTMTKRCLPDFE